MRLGIDFGTTRTVVALVDRGNYPVVRFADTDGDLHDHLPSVVALVDDHLVFGFEAVDAARSGAPALLSFKRLLGAATVTAETTVALGEQHWPLVDLVAAFLSFVRSAVLTAVAETGGDGSEAIDGVVVTVPAHAHTAQRFLTLEAYRQAGFPVIAVVNEPSAAGFEYTHRRPGTLSTRRTQVIVYDLGGGTFDASLVRADGVAHEVLGSVGVNRLGGDDFDVVLAETALAAAGLAAQTLTAEQYRLLLDDCREAKERVSPQSRRLAVEVAGEPVLVAVADFYERAEPLVQQSVSVLEPLLELEGADPGAGLDQVAGIYLVGGGSGLPLVPRLLRERYGRRVHRSPHPAAATAIGAAIAADTASGFTMADRLSRGFGVFREGSGGAEVTFDEIFSGSDRLPSSGTVETSRTYQAAHNLGRFRYVEYGRLGHAGTPQGELIPFADVTFPFDPGLQAGKPIEAVTRQEGGPWVTETYTLDADGLVHVRIEDRGTGYAQTFGARD